MAPSTLQPSPSPTRDVLHELLVRLVTDGERVRVGPDAASVAHAVAGSAARAHVHRCHGLAHEPVANLRNGILLSAVQSKGGCGWLLTQVDRVSTKI